MKIKEPSHLQPSERARERNCGHLQPSEERGRDSERERGRENFRDSYEEGQRNGEMRLKNVRNVEI
jgi:hypothetical protein